MPVLLSGVVADHIAAINAHDADAITATFARDAYVSAEHGEYVGTDAVRRFIEREIIADNVTMEVREVVDHHGDTIVHSRYDGDYDRTNLPDEVILSNYFSVRDAKIITLMIVPHHPAD